MIELTIATSHAFGANEHACQAWHGSSKKRKFYVQVLDASTGAAISAPIEVAVKGNRYHELKAFPDGSVAYVAPGSTNTKIKILRVLPCE